MNTTTAPKIKRSEISTFAAHPVQEHFTDSFSLKSRHGKRHIVMNVGLNDYKKIIEENNITRVRVLALEGEECYIIDERIPYECFR